jgi:hypothetical protein
LTYISSCNFKVILFFTHLPLLTQYEPAIRKFQKEVPVDKRALLYKSSITLAIAMSDLYK